MEDNFFLNLSKIAKKGRKLGVRFPGKIDLICNSKRK
jgi:hypothetical protein